jgi:hypothetical protein
MYRVANSDGHIILFAAQMVLLVLSSFFALDITGGIASDIKVLTF